MKCPIRRRLRPVDNSGSTCAKSEIHRACGQTGFIEPLDLYRATRSSSAVSLKLIRGGDCLGDSDLGRSAGGTGLGDERLELLGSLPFVNDYDEPVADPEAVVDRACGTRQLTEFDEIFGAFQQCLAEFG